MLLVGVMIANSSNCVKSPGWLASIAEGNSIINATLLTLLYKKFLEGTSLSYSVSNYMYTDNEDNILSC